MVCVFMYVRDSLNVITQLSCEQISMILSQVASYWEKADTVCFRKQSGQFVELMDMD